jgi:Ca2+-binding EF-hand superfamily protein
VIDAFDVSGDGQIDFEEFERLFMMLVEIGLIERPRHAG